MSFDKDYLYLRNELFFFFFLPVFLVVKKKSSGSFLDETTKLYARKIKFNRVNEKTTHTFKRLDSNLHTITKASIHGKSGQIWYNQKNIYTNKYILPSICY